MAVLPAKFTLGIYISKPNLNKVTGKSCFHPRIFKLVPNETGLRNCCSWVAFGSGRGPFSGPLADQFWCETKLRGGGNTLAGKVIRANFPDAQTITSAIHDQQLLFIPHMFVTLFDRTNPLLGNRLMSCASNWMSLTEYELMNNEF
jgi:hypothetical protein